MNNKKSITALTALCAIAYFVSYITRVNYGAVILEMVKAEGFTKTAASMALTGSFVTYGAGQLVSGYMGDRIEPHKLIFAGLILSSVMNIMVPLFPNPYLMLVFWSVNGFAQALMWPPMVKILSGLLTMDQYKKSSVTVSISASIGSVMVYLISPLCIMFGGWKTIFFVCAASGLVFAIIWIKSYGKVTKNFENKIELISTKTRKGEGGKLPKKFYGIIGIILVAIILMGYMRDGVNTWTPTYISETFNLGSEVSILSGALLPLFAVICYRVMLQVNRKLIKNELTCASVAYAIGAVGSILILILPIKNAVISVALATIICASMHCVNLMLIGMLPAYFSKYGNVSFMSGLLNAGTYIGSAFSSYGMAAIAEVTGNWNSVIVSWIIATVIGTALCVAMIKGWTKIKED